MTRKLLVILIIFALLPINIVNGQGKDISTSQQVAGVTLEYSGQDGAILEMTAPVYNSQTTQIGGEKYQSMDVPGAESAVEPGKPSMPVVSAMLGIPPEARLELTVLSDDAIGVNGRFNLLPSNQRNPPAEILSVDEQLPQLNSIDDQTDSVFPPSPVKVDEAWLREQHIARLVFYPLQYQPSQGTLVWHKRTRVQLRFISDPSSPTPYKAMEVNKPSPFEAIYQASLLNYDQARTWRGIPLHDQVNLQTSQNAYEATGPRFKIVVDQDGLYRLSYDYLKSAGMDVDNVNPTTFHMSSQGYDVAIYVSGEGDGHFNSGDSITFYGQKFRGDLLAQRYASEGSNYRSFIRQLPNGLYTTWTPQFNATMLEKYTKENVYWLQVGGVGGPRMTTLDGTPGSAPVPVTYTATIHAEESNYWYSYNFSSEDTWYWELIQDQNLHTYPINLEALSTEPFMATIRGEVVARISNTSFNPDHHTQIWLNNTSNLVNDASWDGISRYRFETQVPKSYLGEGLNQLLLKVNFNAYSSQFGDDIYFDWYEIQYPRRFLAVNNQISFERDEAGQDWKYQIGNFVSSPVEVYNITDPFNPQRVINSTLTSGTLTFQSNQSSVVDYFAAGSTAIKSPKSISYYVPPDLKSASNSADYLIITHHDFMAAAQTLANHRAAQGLQTMVVDVADLYNEFNEGIYHSIAIKNFLSYAYLNWTKAPAYVLLIGDGHWNFLNSTTNYLAPPIYIPPHLAWVDPWQGEVDSANLLAAVAGTDILPDMLIARMPVNSVTELNAILNKIIAYENGPEQDWQRHLLFIVDDPDQAGDFGAFTDNIVADYLRPGYQVDRVRNKIDCGGTGLPTCQSVINNELSSTGALIASYIGHASINFWAAENMFSLTDVPDLSNGDRLPVVLSMTCLDGYWIYPGVKNGNQEIPGLIETMLRASDRGAVGAFSPTGLGVATGHDALHRGFFDALFYNGLWELGNASLSAKLRLFGTGSNYDLIQTYTVFGDPAMKIRDPFKTPQIDPVSIVNSGKPGMVVTYTIQVNNGSTVPDTYDINIIPGNAWTVNAPTRIGPIPPGDDRFFQVSVAIPPFAGPLDMDTAIINITSQGDRSEVAATTTLTTQVDQQHGISLVPASVLKLGKPGQPIAYGIEVTNTGIVQDSFTITVSGYNWYTFTIPSTDVSIPAGQKILVSVIVQVPPNAQMRSEDSVSLRVISRSNPNTWADSLLTTVVEFEFEVYLPEILQ